MNNPLGSLECQKFLFKKKRLESASYLSQKLSLAEGKKKNSASSNNSIQFIFNQFV